MGLVTKENILSKNLQRIKGRVPIESVSSTPLSVAQLEHIEWAHLCRIVQSYPEKIPQKIKALIESKDPPSMSSIASLRKYMKARDTVIIWAAIVKELKTESSELDDTFWSDFDEVIDIANGYQQWCKDNKDSLAKVRKLDVSKQCLTTFDGSVLPQLELLYLRDNYLVDIDLRACPNLDFLDLKNNYLTSLGIVRGAFNLKTLRLEGNYLTSFDGSLYPYLKELRIKNNQLKTIKGCPQLKWLFLANNQLQTLDVYSHLEWIDAENNQLTAFDPRGYLKLKWLALSNNRLENFNGEEDSHLKEVRLLNNPLTEIPKVPPDCKLFCDVTPVRINPFFATIARAKTVGDQIFFFTRTH